MRKVNLPGFSGEASLYGTKKSYYVAGGANALTDSGKIVLQSRRTCNARCLGRWIGRSAACFVHESPGFCKFMADEMFGACTDNCEFYD